MNGPHVTDLPPEIWQRVFWFAFGYDLRTRYVRFHLVTSPVSPGPIPDLSAQHSDPYKWMSTIIATLRTCKTFYRLVLPIFLRQIDMFGKPDHVMEKFIHLTPPKHLAFVKELSISICNNRTFNRLSMKDSEIKQRLEIFATLIETLPRLSVFNIEDVMFHASLYRVIASKSATLTELSVSCVDDADSPDAARLISLLPLIRTLRVGWLDVVDDHPLGSAISSLEHLTTLSFTFCNFLQDSWGDLDWKNGANMLDFALVNTLGLNTAGLAKLLAVFSSVNRLVLSAHLDFTGDRDAAEELHPDRVTAIDVPSLKHLVVSEFWANEKLPFTVFRNCPLTTLDIYNVDPNAMEYIVGQLVRGVLPECRQIVLFVKPDHYAAVWSMAEAIEATSHRTIVVNQVLYDMELDGKS